MRISDWSSDVCSSDLTDLPMRAVLLSVAGDGHNLAFSIQGEGKVVIDIANPGTDGIVVTGAAGYSQVGEIVTVDLGGYRSEERRVGKECVSTCSSRWSPHH